MKSTPHLLTDILFRPDPRWIRQRLRIPEDAPEASLLGELLAEGQRIGKPKALYRPVCTEERIEEGVKVEGQWFHSRILSVNLRAVHRIFLYVATCGWELELWAKEKKRSLKTYYWAQAVKEAALEQALLALHRHVEEHYRPGRLAHQNPGSLSDFPLSEQWILFRLLGDAPEAIGVRLLPGGAMTPPHSVSGILFPTEEDFYSCLLCSRKNCPSRRAPYDPTLYARKYARP